MRKEKELSDSLYVVFTRAGMEAAHEAVTFINSLGEANLKKAADDWDSLFDEQPDEATTLTVETESGQKSFFAELASFSALASVVENVLSAVGTNAYRLTVEQYGFGKPDGEAANLLAPPAYRAYQTPDFVAQYAHERGADMVGRKWVDGKLVNNPDAQWVITDTTRKEINQLIQDVVAGKLKATDLRQAIIDSDAFSKARAEMIARTELVNANAYGSLMGMYESRAMGLNILKGWDSTGEACPICMANTDAGFIKLEKKFPSGHQCPTAHVNCMCVLISKVLKED